MSICRSVCGKGAIKLAHAPNRETLENFRFSRSVQNIVTAVYSTGIFYLFFLSRKGRLVNYYIFLLSRGRLGSTTFEKKYVRNAYMRALLKELVFHAFGLRDIYHRPDSYLDSLKVAISTKSTMLAYGGRLTRLDERNIFRATAVYSSYSVFTCLLFMILKV